MIGIDIVKVDRMKRMMERFKDRSLKKFLSEDEILFVKNYKSASGLWAAKEACSKALGVGISKECTFFDMKIYKDEKGAPHIKLSEHLIKKYHIKDISLSITHDGDYAIAVVAIESAIQKANIR